MKLWKMLALSLSAVSLLVSMGCSTGSSAKPTPVAVCQPLEIEEEELTVKLLPDESFESVKAALAEALVKLGISNRAYATERECRQEILKQM